MKVLDYVSFYLYITIISNFLW